MSMDVNNISMPPVSPRSKRKLDENTVTDQPAPQIRRTSAMDDINTPVTDAPAMDTSAMDTSAMDEPAVQYETESGVIPVTMQDKSEEAQAQENAEAEAAANTEAELNTWNTIATDNYEYDYTRNESTTNDKPPSPETIETALISDLVCKVVSSASTERVIKPATDSVVFNQNRVDLMKQPSKHFSTVFSNSPVDIPIYKAITILTNAINKETSKPNAKQTELESYIKYLKQFLEDLLTEQYSFITDNITEILLKNPKFNEYVGVMTKPSLTIKDSNFVFTKNPLEIGNIESIIKTYIKMCLNKPKLLQDPNHVLSKLDDGHKFFPKFIDFLNPSQSTDAEMEIETQLIDSPDAEQKLDMSPGLTFLSNGLQRNYEMENNFNGKIQKTNVVVFGQIQPPIKTLLDKIAPIPLGEQIQEYMNQILPDDTHFFKYTKYLEDAADLMHDAEKVLADSAGEMPDQEKGYYAALVNIGNTKFKGLGFDKLLLQNCLTNKPTQITDKQGKIDFWYGVQQDKLRRMRTEAINRLRNRMSLSIMLPNISTTTLTRETGYFELIKQIFTIWGSSPNANPPGDPFVYKESGRDLQINNICEYYKLLPVDEQTKFIQDCAAYCDFPDSNNITSFLSSLVLSKDACTHSLLVPLTITTSFDGCGTSRIDKGDNCAKAVFNNVYGLYTYTIYTTLCGETVGKFCHLVTVTLTPVTGQTEQPVIIAVFGLTGNITINMLLKQNKMPTIRTGEGTKGDFYDITKIYNLLKTRCNKGQLDTWLVSLDLKNIQGEGKVFYPTPEISKNEQDLLVLGNKTIGDLIVTAYPTTPLVRAIVTVDSLIANSTMYNFLCGNSSILQSVWMQSGGKGWRFTPGLANEDATLKPLSISIQILSTYMLLNDISASKIDSLKDMQFVVNRLNPDFVTIIHKITQSTLDIKKLTPLLRLTNFITYTFNDFKTIANYEKKGAIYEACFTQLLIYENYIMQCRVWYYLQLLDVIMKKYDQDVKSSSNSADINGVTSLEKCQIDFLNSINTLPKLQTFLISNISNAFSNNSSTVSIKELIHNFPPLNPTDKFISIEHINSTKIKIKYDYKPGPTTADKFKKETNEVTILAEGKFPQGSRVKVWSITFEFPYMIDILIQLLDTGKIKEPDLTDGSSPMSTDVATPSADNGIITDIQQRIKSFFETNVSTLDMEYNTIKLNDASNNNLLVTTVLTNITNILVAPGVKLDGQPRDGILPLGTELTLGSPSEYDESPCGEGDCANGECENQMVEGGNKKTTRKKRKTKQKRKTKGGKKPGKNKTKKQRKNRKNTKTRRRK